jgi:uncharacterized protein (TIGR02466 family)|tara:strand:- start:281 stop:919 length:639 start_codon:yes stop_codon:yes gene_type:complete
MSLFNNLWGVPIYKENVNYTYSNFDKDTQDFVDKYIENTKPFSGLGGVKIFKAEGRFLENPELEKIKDLVNQHAQIFRDRIMECTNELQMSASWITVNHKGDVHDQHKHPHAIFSVCYYPKVESGELKLLAPDYKNTFEKDYYLGFSYSKCNIWNSRTWSIPVLSGDIVIFPGWVVHHTTPNESDTPRLMIGANYWLKGEMKFSDELDSITI